jgi:hypothetical protein
MSMSNRNIFSNLLIESSDNDTDNEEVAPETSKPASPPPPIPPPPPPVEEEVEVTNIETENKQEAKLEEPFEETYEKKPYRKFNKRHEENSNENSSVFRDDKLLENKQMYDENKSYGDVGNDKKLNSYWTVWIHKINSTDWTLSGYQKIYVINSIGSFWRFFNNFQLYNTYQNQIFIMREEVAPIWEDVNNKFGGICSIKIDSIQKGMRTDLSTEVFNLISLLVMNETFVAQDKKINGISYSVKKRSSLIKVWTKSYSPEHDFIKDLPVPLMNKFNVEMQKQSKNVLNNDGKISIQYKQIKPEFEL